MPRPLSLVLALTVCQAASAGTLYKCVEGGRISYGDRPCPGATELAVPAAPTPDPALQERLARERTRLLELDKVKLTEARQEARQEAREAEQNARRAQRAAQAERKRCDKLRLQRQWADEDLARQRGGAGKEAAQDAARLKARRQAETLAVECPA